MRTPLSVRLRLAWSAFRLNSLSVSWGKTVHVNTPRPPRYCDYPNACADYEKSRVKCGEPVTECIGRSGLRLEICTENEDFEYCPKHQEDLRRKRGEM